MHCMDTDYSVFTLLPPFNFADRAAHRLNGKLVNDDAIKKKDSLAYVAMTDGAGSTNSSHNDNNGNVKTYFWEILPKRGVRKAC